MGEAEGTGARELGKKEKDSADFKEYRSKRMVSDAPIAQRDAINNPGEMGVTGGRWDSTKRRKRTGGSGNGQTKGKK